jgi:parallel beta-helix repeat protein
VRKKNGVATAALFLLLCAAAAVAADGAVIRVTGYEELGNLPKRLREDPRIREVVFTSGVYHASLSFGLPKDFDAAKHPVLLRVEEGAEVVFDGANREAAFGKAQPDERRPGVYSIPYTQIGNDVPKLWEPEGRIRYRLVADVESVARFPATYAVDGDRLHLRTSDGRPPAPGRVMFSHQYLDYGIFIDRPNVTVRGFKFRNYLIRDVWSTGIQLRADNVTVEDCEAVNCSIGFTVVQHNGVVRNCRVEDCGGGIYIGGNDATVENCRLFKRRDAFMVPMYAQDDAGIQFYYPAKGGTMRGNLCVGFKTGIFIKAAGAPYVVEHNTLDGLGQGTGFGATKWSEGQRFRHNVVANVARDIDPLPAPPEGRTRELDSNCYWSPGRTDVKPIGPRDIVADPKFVWPALGDYRLANDSPALKLADAAGPAGAFPAIGNATPALGAPREWHVSESGRDGRDATAERPVKTIQFAVDRAKPGDTITVHPGLYPDPVAITRGGTAERPIVLRAAEKWKAILDSNREARFMISVTEAPHVQIRDLEIRWYAHTAIRIEKSPDVTVSGCRIWNAHWYGAWPTGTAIYGYLSPRLTVQGNVLFRQEHGVWVHSCPNSSVTDNTCVANLYSAASLYHSEGCVMRNNSFAFSGNDVIVIQLNKGQAAKLKEFDCDYNNYGTPLRQVPQGAAVDMIEPRKQDAMLDLGSKAIVNYTEHGGEMKRILTMKEWREFSGLDTHTIYADPLYVNAAARDFRPGPGSPNVAAGVKGATIGALPAAPKEKP